MLSTMAHLKCCQVLDMIYDGEVVQRFVGLGRFMMLLEWHGCFGEVDVAIFVRLAERQ